MLKPYEEKRDRQFLHDFWKIPTICEMTPNKCNKSDKHDSEKNEFWLTLISVISTEFFQHGKEQGQCNPNSSNLKFKFKILFQISKAYSSGKLYYIILISHFLHLTQIPIKIG